MSRYIDAEAFIKHLEKDPLFSLVEKYGISSVIKAFPTADVVEVVHGEWIEQDDGWDGVYYECSACKEAFTLIDGTPTDNLYNFCPNCGADMRGGTNECE